MFIIVEGFYPKVIPGAKKLLADWPSLAGQYGGDEHVVKIRDKEIRTRLTRSSLSGSTIRKVYLPRFECASILIFI